MTDYISRADAIEAMDELWGDIKRTNKRVAKGHEAVYLDMRATISALPSADAVQGEWKHTITWQSYCSNCEYVFGEDEEFSPFWNYCPMCGARMKGGDSE